MLSGYLWGSFDLFNVGDLDVIAQARAQCERLVVGVLSDEDVARYHGRPPVVPAEERMAILRHVRGVAGVVLHEDDERAAADLVFAASPDDLRPLDPDDWSAGATLLTAHRATASPTLLDALRPFPQTSVA